MSETLHEKFAGIRVYLRICHHLNNRAQALKRKCNYPASAHYFDGLHFLVSRYKFVWGNFEPADLRPRPVREARA